MQRLLKTKEINSPNKKMGIINRLADFTNMVYHEGKK